MRVGSGWVKPGPISGVEPPPPFLPPN
eukprot:COSAG01_NODE_61368_length_290_cov_0.424084_1_plen_26_part_10